MRMYHLVQTFHPCNRYTTVQNIITMFGLFKKDPKKKLEKEYKNLLIKARDVQRSGDIIAYSGVVAESEAVLAKIKALEEQEQNV